MSDNREAVRLLMTTPSVLQVAMALILCNHSLLSSNSCHVTSNLLLREFAEIVPDIYHNALENSSVIVLKINI